MEYVYLASWATDADADAWNDDRPRMSSGDLAEPNVRFVLDSFGIWDAMALAELFIEDQVDLLEGDEEEQNRVRELRFTVRQPNETPFVWYLEAEARYPDVDMEGKDSTTYEYYGCVMVVRRRVGLD